MYKNVDEHYYIELFYKEIANISEKIQVPFTVNKTTVIEDYLKVLDNKIQQTLYT